ncbi:hypothetical protein [Paraburkholderia nemoris]|uniref:hypothetical protein n=1 Tax=Paraburkholderia nemoris TaxID=2793076 RepID=UPI0038BAA025
MATINGEQTLTALPHQIDVRPNQIIEWKRKAHEHAADVFGAGGSASSGPQVNLKALYAKIGQFTLKNYFLSGALNKACLLSATHDLSYARIATHAAGASRWYRKLERVLRGATGEGGESLVDTSIDEPKMECQIGGAPMLARPLLRQAHEIRRRRVRTLIKRMGGSPTRSLGRQPEDAA